MRPMKKIAKSKLLSLIRIVVFANTPRSLFTSLRKTSIFSDIQKLSTPELILYYDRVTSKTRDSPFLNGLGYALLLAILEKIDDPQNFDAGRLLWGEEIKEIHIGTSTNINTTSIVWTPTHVSRTFKDSVHIANKIEIIRK